MPIQRIHPHRGVEPPTTTLPSSSMDPEDRGTALRVPLLIATMSTRVLLIVLPVITTPSHPILPTRPTVLTRRRLDTIRIRTTRQEDTMLLPTSTVPITATPHLIRTRKTRNVGCSRTTTQIVMATT